MIEYYQTKQNKEIKQILYTGPLQEQIPQLLPPQPPSSLLETPTTINHQQYLGYALSQMPIAPAENPKSINLTPPHIHSNYQETNTGKLKKTLFIISLIFLIILNLFSGFILFKIFSKQSNINQHSNELILATENFTTKINQLNKQTDTVINILNQKNNFSQAVNIIFNKLPKELKINYINFNAQTKSINIRGHAESQEQVIEYKNTLSQEKIFSTVNLPFSNLAQRKNFDFTIELKWTNQ